MHLFSLRNSLFFMYQDYVIQCLCPGLGFCLVVHHFNRLFIIMMIRMTVIQALLCRLMHHLVVQSYCIQTYFLWIPSQTPLPYLTIHHWNLSAAVLSKCDECYWSAGERLSAEGGVASSGLHSAERTFLELCRSWLYLKKNKTIKNNMAWPL